ncbi:hypothetical protein CDL15_Pgr029164 [Punica granatum]|uniref:Uncharacterized protein n=1 Tax=Punica granatum TaxID=22663 RepID=A0A218X782_PUNGR|nr:hypothetical protein CDL15_Pgr029164 [Punica granatum]
MHTCASLLSCYASSPSLLASASCYLDGSAHPYELLSGIESSQSLLARVSCNLARSAHPCEFTFMLRKFAEPAGSYFLRPCRVCSPVRIYFHVLQVCRASWHVLLTTLPGMHTCASLLSCYASSPSLLASASCYLDGSAHPYELLSGIESSQSLLARVSCDFAESAHPCEFTFTLRKDAEPARSCFL